MSDQIEISYPHLRLKKKIFRYIRIGGHQHVVVGRFRVSDHAEISDMLSYDDSAVRYNQVFFVCKMVVRTVTRYGYQIRNLQSGARIPIY